MFNDFFGFLENPFEDTPDPRFFYSTSSYRETLNSLIDCIKTRAGFMSITGEAGTGKTALIHLLLDQLDEKVKVALIFHTSITFVELLSNILVDLGLAVGEKHKQALLGQLNGYLDRLGEDETVAVIIDESQKLSEKVLKEFESFFSLNPMISKDLQIVFVGQPDFEEKLNSPALRQLNKRIKIRRQIMPLIQEESKEYIAYRLKKVGSSDLEIFNPEAIAMICSYARGIPRTINILCDNALLRGYSLSKKKIDPDIIQEVIKNLEGPVPQKAFLSSTISAKRGIVRPTPNSTLLIKRVSLAVLVLLCLGVWALVTSEYLRRRPTEIWKGKISDLPADTRPSSEPYPLGEAKEQERKGESPHPVSKQEIPFSESPDRASPPSSFSSRGLGGDKIEEIVVVKEGDTISLLVKMFYRTSNASFITLILDYNPEITNADFITVGQKIKMPKLTEELLIRMVEHEYRIHIGTFVNSDIAGFYRNEPALKGKELEILPRKVSPKETWYTVAIGRFENKDEAFKMIDLLKEQGLLPFFGGAPKKK